jgi:hypothetical protein
MTSTTRLTALALTLPLAGAMAQDLIVNGNFEAGNTGFSNDYNYSPTDMQSARTYCVVANPASVHGSWASFGDHTTSSGLMLVANGDVTPANVVSLEAGQWFSLGAPCPGNGSILTVTNGLSQEALRFYRVLAVN